MKNKTMETRKMTNKEMAAALKDLYNQFEANKKKWVAKFRTTDGFSNWFTGQLKRAGIFDKKR